MKTDSRMGHVAVTIVLAVQVIALSAHSQNAEVSSDTLPELIFHHIVFDMTDSLAEVTEMLVFHNKLSTPYTEDGGILIPLARGFIDLRLSGSQGDWELHGSPEGVRYVGTLPRGMTRLVLNYNLIAQDGFVEFTENVVHSTGRFIFVTSNEEIEIESDVLAKRESIKSGEKEVKGVSAEDLEVGTEVTVLARVVAPGGARRGPGVPAALAVMFVLFILVYVTARAARTTLTGQGRLTRLEGEKASIVKAIGEVPEDQKQALTERLAAKQRLIDLLLETTDRGTEG